MEDSIVNTDTPNGEPTVETEPVESSTEGLDTDALQEKLKETEQANRQLFERAKKAEGFVKLDGKWVKAKAESTPNKVETPSRTGDLDETALDYLDLKGVSEPEDIELIESVVKKTGQTVRQALKDDYVISKLASLKQAREIKIATPGSSRRAGQASTGDVDYWLAENERTGKLPEDFELRKKVVEAKERRFGDNAPPWRK